MNKQPQIWTRPLGENADVNKIEDDVAVDSGNISFSKLFGKITAVPLEEGGIAPEREDFNALFKLLGELHTTSCMVVFITMQIILIMK